MQVLHSQCLHDNESKSSSTPHATPIMSLLCTSDRLGFNVETPLGKGHKAAVSNVEGQEIGKGWNIALSWTAAKEGHIVFRHEMVPCMFEDFCNGNIESR
jgi:hypothetical protein